MTEMLFLFALAAACIAIGWMIAMRPSDGDIVDRYVMRDQQHYERLKAYRELEKKIKEEGL
jgi:hypothetical protein